MGWPLTILGAVLGVWLAGVAGAVFGAMLGHALDRYWQLRYWRDLPRLLARRLGLRPDFEAVLFLALGRVAKSGGRVLPEHLQLARALMQQYRLDETQRLVAMSSFNRGKRPDTRIEQPLRRLLRQHPGRAAELLDCCWRMALVQGPAAKASGQLLERWSGLAGLTPAEQQRLRQRHQRHQRGQTGSGAPATTGGTLQQAAALLGVDLMAEPAQIKRAYRRLLSRHHPDKLVATGASQAELAAAGEQVHRVQQAYEIVRRYRGFR